jgi:hypothetical protein
VTRSRVTKKRATWKDDSLASPKRMKMRVFSPSRAPEPGFVTVTR